MKRAEFFGNLPFPPDQKKPAVIRKKDQKALIFSPEVPEESNLVTVAVSTDQLHCGFLEMGPGSNWRFVDEHLGDETYYIISGNLTELECVTGECVEANVGDTLYIPMGCKHKGYNFSEDKLLLLWAIAPQIWPEETDTSFAQESIRMYKNGQDSFRLARRPGAEFDLRKQYKLCAGDVNQLGSFPLPGKEARAKPIFYYVMNERRCLTTIFGVHRPMRQRYFVSNDQLHVGELYLPSGGVGSRTSEVDEHGGDSAIYCVRGPMTVFLPDAQETYLVDEGDLIYLPPRTKHQFVNYNKGPMIGYFIVANTL